MRGRRSDRAVIGTTTSSSRFASSSSAATCACTASQNPAGASRSAKPAERVARGAHLGQLVAPLGRRLELRLDRGALGVGELTVEVRRQHVGIEHVGSGCERRSRSGHPVGDERGAQQAPPPVDARPHGADRHAGGLGDLFVGEVADVAEHDRHPEVVGERAERALDLVGEAGRAPRRPPGSWGARARGRRGGRQRVDACADAPRRGTRSSRSEPTSLPATRARSARDPCGS